MAISKPQYANPLSFAKPEAMPSTPLMSMPWSQTRDLISQLSMPKQPTTIENLFSGLQGLGQSLSALAPKQQKKQMPQMPSMQIQPFQQPMNLSDLLNMASVNEVMQQQMPQQLTLLDYIRLLGGR